jgi:hypothetical protein
MGKFLRHRGLYGAFYYTVLFDDLAMIALGDFKIEQGM